MRVFVSNVDKPIGHHISRVFANSPVTYRHEAEEAAEGAAEPAQEEADASPQPAVKDVYVIHGTLTPPQPPSPFQHDSKPGVMAYTGDKKKDAARKEAIEKFSVVGVKPAWVEASVDVCI